MTLKDLKLLRPNALVLLLQLMKPQNKHCKAVLPSFLLQLSELLRLQCPSLKKPLYTQNTLDNTKITKRIGYTS